MGFVAAKSIGGVRLQLLPDKYDAYSTKINSSILRKEYRGQGIMRDLYTALACYFDNLHSDTLVTKEASRVWQSLKRSKRIEVVDIGDQYLALCKE